MTDEGVLLTCTQCDPPGDWIAARPGTIYPKPKWWAPRIYRDLPTIVWCANCWPFLKKNNENTGARPQQ